MLLTWSSKGERGLLSFSPLRDAIGNFTVPSSDEKGDRRRRKAKIKTGKKANRHDDHDHRSSLCDQNMIVWWVWKSAIPAVSSLPIKKRAISSIDKQRALERSTEHKSCEKMESMGRTVRQSSISPSHSQHSHSSAHRLASTSPVYVVIPLSPTPWPKLWHKKQREFINSARPVNCFGKSHIHSFVIKPEIVTNLFFCQNQKQDVSAIAISSRFRTVVVEHFWFSLDIQLGNFNQNNPVSNSLFNTTLLSNCLK